MASSRRRNMINDSANLVQARLLGMIEQGGLPADARLPTERDLSEKLGVGRSSVRLALEALMAKGLIWRQQGKGTFVGQPPDKTQVLAAEIVGETNFAEIMAARICIEPTLAAMSARNVLPADVARMRDLASLRSNSFAVRCSRTLRACATWPAAPLKPQTQILSNFGTARSTGLSRD